MEEDALSGDEALNSGGGERSVKERCAGLKAECLECGRDMLWKGGEVMEEIAIGLWEERYA